MNKKYMLFLDEYDVSLLKQQVDEALEAAIKSQVKVRVVALTGLLTQLRQPRELQRKPKSTAQLVKEQVFGK